MLRSLASIILPLVARHGIKTAFKRLARKVAVFMAAALLMLGAGAFALVAVYQLLRDAGFAVDAAAGIMTGGLVVSALVVLGINSLVDRRRSRTQVALSRSMSDPGATGMVDKQLERVVRQVGPLSVLAVAFLVGLTAGRK